MSVRPATEQHHREGGEQGDAKQRAPGDGGCPLRPVLELARGDDRRTGRCSVGPRQRRRLGAIDMVTVVSDRGGTETLSGTMNVQLSEGSAALS